MRMAVASQSWEYQGIRMPQLCAILEIPCLPRTVWLRRDFSSRKGPAASPPIACPDDAAVGAVIGPIINRSGRRAVEQNHRIVCPLWHPQNDGGQRIRGGLREAQIHIHYPKLKDCLHCFLRICTQAKDCQGKPRTGQFLFHPHKTPFETDSQALKLNSAGVQAHAE